jgi:hypothetical protein
LKLCIYELDHAFAEIMKMKMVSISRNMFVKDYHIATYVHGFTGYDDYTGSDNAVHAPATISEPGFLDNLQLQL